MENLIKAFDIIIENQRNSDTKAYTFILIISAFLTFMNQIPLQGFDLKTQEHIQYTFLITLIPLLFFIFSLRPKFSSQYRLLRFKRKESPLNIFYWGSISVYENEEKFFNAFHFIYTPVSLDRYEEGLLKQIYVNANILESKKVFQSFAFFFINQFCLLLFCLLIGFLFLAQNVLLTFILILVSEVIAIALWIHNFGFKLDFYGLKSRERIYIKKLFTKSSNQKKNKGV